MQQESELRKCAMVFADGSLCGNLARFPERSSYCPSCHSKYQRAWRKRERLRIGELEAVVYGDSYSPRVMNMPRVNVVIAPDVQQPVVVMAAAPITETGFAYGDMGDVISKNLRKLRDVDPPAHPKDCLCIDCMVLSS